MAGRTHEYTTHLRELVAIPTVRCVGNSGSLVPLEGCTLGHARGRRCLLSCACDVHACVCARGCACLRLCVRVYAHAHTHTHTRTHAHTRAHAQLLTCVELVLLRRMQHGGRARFSAAKERHATRDLVGAGVAQAPGRRLCPSVGCVLGGERGYCAREGRGGGAEERENTRARGYCARACTCSGDGCFHPT